MTKQDFARVIISHHDKVLVDVEVTAPVMLLGSSGHSDIRLGADLMAPEQLRFTLRGAALDFAVLAAEPPTRLRGVALAHGTLQSGDVLEVGALRIQTHVTVAVDAPSSKLRRNVGLGVAVVGVALVMAVALFLSAQFGKRRDGMGPPSPDLFADLAKVRCAETNGQAARAAAGQLLEEAAGRQERAPFSPREAVKAVVAFEQAGGCLQLAGDQEGSAYAKGLARSMQRKTQKAFHVHRVRLEHAMSTKDDKQTRTELRVLNNYLAGRTDAYAVWIQNLSRRMAVKK